MIRRGLIGLVVAAMAGVAAMSSPSPALAFTAPPQDVWNDPAQTTAFKSLLATPDVTEAATMSEEAATALTKARMSGGFLPLLSKASAMSSALVGGYWIGSTIARAVDIEGRIGGTYPASGGSVTAWHWNWISTGANGGIDTGQDFSGEYAATAAWIGYDDSAGVGIHYTGGTNCGYNGAWYTFTTGYAGTVGTPYTHGYGNCGGGTASRLVATEQEMLDNVTMRTRSQATNPGGGWTNITGTFTPTDPTGLTTSSTEIVDARTALDDALSNGDITTGEAEEIAFTIDPTYEGSPPAEYTMPDCEGLTYAACLALLEAEGFVGTVITNTWGISDAVLTVGGGRVTSTNPTVGTGAIALDADVTFNVNPDPLPLELQAQLVNESVTEYLDRIGYAGPSPTITYLDTSTGDPELGPDAPVRWRFPLPGGGTTTVPVPKPGETPTPFPRVPNDPTGDPPEIFVNPPGFPPIEDGGGYGGCDQCPPLDMTPLTGLDWGENFPFGIFTWLGATWTDMTGADSTCIRAPFGKPSGIGGGTLVVALCSEAWVTTYRDPFFLLVEFVFTVALIIGLARRMTATDGMVDEA